MFGDYCRVYLKVLYCILVIKLFMFECIKLNLSFVLYGDI